MAIDAPTREINPDLVTDILKQMPPSSPPEHKEGGSKNNKLTPSQVRYSSEDAVRQEVVLTLQDNIPFDKDVVSALFAREQEHFLKDVYRTKEVVWPLAAAEKPPSLLGTNTQPDGKPYTYTATIDGKQVSSIPATYIPEKDTLARKAFKTLPLHEKKDVLSYLVDIRYVHPDALIQEVTTNESQKPELLKHLMRLLYEQKDAYNYPRYDFAKNWKKDNIDQFVKAFTETVEPKDILQAVTAQPKDRLGAVGMLIGEKGVARVLNDIRSTLQLKNLDKTAKAKLDLLGRQLLGNESLPFHQSLHQFYEATHELFTTYEAINNEATKKDVTRLRKKVFPLVTSSQPYTIVSDACGTGRIANMLAADDDPRIEKIIGIDISTIDLEKAQTTYDAVPPPKTPTIYTETDWETLEGIADASIDVFEGYGRSFMHATDENMFLKLLAIRKAKLKPGGIFTCNFANPNKGAYLHNRQVHIDVLKRAGIPITTDASQIGLSSTVDSPDGINFVDRFVPQIENVVYMGEKMGFTVEIIERTSIPGERWGESEDVYFVFKKSAD